MNEKEEYRTIGGTATGEYRDRGSRFIAHAYPVKDEKEVKEILQKIRKEHPKANHHCHAFRLGSSGEIYRLSDDREPAGSAGKPIYGVLLSNDITDVLVVVVRYFGGSLLGVPGLIQAYRGASSEAISNSLIVIRPVVLTFRLDFDYGLYPDVMKLVKRTEGTIIDQSMGDSCSVRVEIRKSSYSKFKDAVDAMYKGCNITKL